MKIYNKKGLLLGVVWFMLGSWLLILRILGPEFFLPEQIKDIVLSLLLIVIGIGCILGAVSKRAAREEKLEELDERNQLIELKTKSKSFRLTQGICFCLMIAFFIMAKVWGETLFTGAGMGLGFAYAISMFTELFTNFYYEIHN